MKTKKTIWIVALAACAMSAASAQTAPEPRVVSAAEFCSKMPVPKWPEYAASSATFQVSTVVREGKVTSVDVRTIKSTGLDRTKERTVKNAVIQAVRLYECKADGLYTIEQTMEFLGS